MSQNPTPLRRPVPSLVTLCLTATGVYIDQNIEQISKRTYEHIVNDPPDGSQESPDAKCNKYLNQQIEHLREVLFKAVPINCHDRLLETILEVLADRNITVWQNARRLGNWSLAIRLQYFTEGRTQSERPEVMHLLSTIEDFAKLAVQPTIKTMDLSQLSRVLRSGILSDIHKMAGLEKLNLSSRGCIGAWKGLWKSLRSLTKLRHLTLQNDCQNECLAVLGQNCPDLVYLDISGSQSVTDSGATWLLHCRKLIHLDLYQTEVNVQVYAQLLLGLSGLATVGRCDKFGQVLEYMALHQSKPKSLPVRVFHSRDMSRSQLQLLAEMCPKLTHVSLYVDEDMRDLLTPLTELKELEDLKLLACNFYADKVDVLLKSSGHQLTLLHLEHIDELDMNALTCIAETCVNLEKLVFFSCDFVENFGQAIPHRPFMKRPFRNLEVLVCISESAPNVIEFLLVNAICLKRVQFGSTAWFNDATVANVIAKGALKNVEEIRILRSYELTIRSVYLLIENCPKLRVLSEMDGWEGICANDLVDLRNKVQTENLQLDTYATWNIITG